jgi:DNA repair protein SbcD/Mre11
VHYCGSPIAVDFGEQDNTPVVLVVEAGVGTPASVAEVPVIAGRRLRTVRGTVSELAGLADQVGEDYLRVYVREPARAGLREQVQELLPNALEVRLDADFAARGGDARPATGSGPVERSPGELFHEYCEHRGVADERVEALFARLHDQILAADG